MGIDQTYLAHDGIKNMKWGLRRYRNYDGTLTAEGKERYYKRYGQPYTLDDDIQNKKMLKENSESLKKSAESLRTNSNIFRENARKANMPTSNSEASKIPTDELRKKVNRMNLENRYKDEMAFKTTSKKPSFYTEAGGNILGIAGGVSAVAGGTLKLAGKLKGNASVENVGDILLSAGGAAGLFSGALRTLSKTSFMNKGKPIKVDLSKYSDDELNKIVERMNLEKRYAIEKSRYSTNTKSTVYEILADASDISSEAVNITKAFNDQEYFYNGYDIGNIENAKKQGK